MCISIYIQKTIQATCISDEVVLPRRGPLRKVFCVKICCKIISLTVPVVINAQCAGAQSGPIFPRIFLTLRYAEVP